MVSPGHGWEVGRKWITGKRAGGCWLDFLNSGLGPVGWQSNPGLPL